MSFQLYVYTDLNCILNFFPLLETIIIESICIRVKGLDLYIKETACIFIKVNVILLFKYEEFLFN